MAIDTYQNEEDRLRKEELKKAGTPEEPEDTLTVKQILDDKEKSGLFGKMLEHDGDPADKEIMARLVSGKMEEGDIDRLAEARATFAEKMRDADTVRLEINPEMAQEMAKNDPEFEKILKIVGPERAAMFIEKEMREL
ncbi:MAG: hypothetical protein P4L61_04300, partial [Candidatus Pacebacteria bacterium]|nr:hypothetical protein [Candidatus Paceibacterota bacterium]